MNKYFAIFCVPAATMAQWAATVPEEERKAQSDKMMQDWQAWQNDHLANIVDKGNPLGKTKRVTKDSIIDTKNDLNYCMVIEAESHVVAADIIKGNPHLQIPDSYVDVMEIPHMEM